MDSRASASRSGDAAPGDGPERAEVERAEAERDDRARERSSDPAIGPDAGAVEAAPDDTEDDEGEGDGAEPGFAPPSGDVLRAARRAMGDRPLVLVGLMGVGKTTVGRQVAQMLALPFTDADEEIEAVSRMSVADLFSAYGEPEFRALERRVIERLARSGPGVLATGGGAFVDPETRALLKERTTTLWLRAELDVLVERTGRRNTRPLLRTGDPRAILKRLMKERHPLYATADAEVESVRRRREVIAGRVIAALAAMDEAADEGPNEAADQPPDEATDGDGT